MYKRSRLVRARGPGGRYTFGSTGETEVVSARGRGSGGRGFISGAGETELQLQRRRIIERRNQLLSEIKEVRRTRALQRASCKRHGSTNGQDMATVAVVGYTNAGKSTLVSSLTDSYLYCDDRLFATVDPKLRSVVLPSGRKLLLSDSVGFISELPVQLVEAFHATLEEVVEADLLVHVLDSGAPNLDEHWETVMQHVLDSSAPNLDEHWETVMQVLEQLEVSKEKLQNMIEVWNKIDIGEEEMGIDEYGEEIEVRSYSGEEGESVEFEQLSGEDLDEYDYDDDNLECEQSPGDPEGIMNDDQGDSSDGWLASRDGQETWDDQDGSSLGLETLDYPPKHSSRDCRITSKDFQCRPESIPHVKTCAIMGVGLQELLELIDERLKPQKVVQRSVFDRKWRPPRTDETGIAVEQ